MPCHGPSRPPLCPPHTHSGGQTNNTHNNNSNNTNNNNHRNTATTTSTRQPSTTTWVLTFYLTSRETFLSSAGFWLVSCCVRERERERERETGREPGVRTGKTKLSPQRRERGVSAGSALCVLRYYWGCLICSVWRWRDLMVVMWYSQSTSSLHCLHCLQWLCSGLFCPTQDQ